MKQTGCFFSTLYRVRWCSWLWWLHPTSIRSYIIWTRKIGYCVGFWLSTETKYGPEFLSEEDGNAELSKFSWSSIYDDEDLDEDDDDYDEYDAEQEERKEYVHLFSSKVDIIYFCQLRVMKLFNCNSAASW